MHLGGYVGKNPGIVCTASIVFVLVCCIGYVTATRKSRHHYVLYVCLFFQAISPNPQALDMEPNPVEPPTFAPTVSLKGAYGQQSVGSGDIIQALSYSETSQPFVSQGTDPSLAGNIQHH